MIAFLFLALFWKRCLGNHRHKVGLSFFDIVLGLAIGLFSSLFAVVYLSKVHLNFPYFESDFVDYCQNLITFDSDSDGSDKRTRLAGMLDYAFSNRYGIVNGMAFASVCGLGLIFSAVFYWATMFRGRLAGLLAVIAALSMTPVVSMGLILNFYPTIIAVFVISGAFCSLSLLKKHPKNHLLAGIGVSLCLLVDVRGLLWASFYSLAVLFFGFKFRRGPIYNLKLLMCFIVPIVLSWPIGNWSYPQSAKSLEEQIDVRPLFYSMSPTPEYAPNRQGQYTYDSQFIWGRSNPIELPKTAAFLMEQRQITPPEETISALGNTKPHQTYHHFWLFNGVLCFIGACLLNRKWSALAALSIPGIPFAMAYIGAKDMVEMQLRFYAHSLPFIAVVIGVFVASIPIRSNEFDLRFKTIGRVGVLTVSLFLLIGSIPSNLSPFSTWRPGWKANTKSLNEIQRLASNITQLTPGESWQVDCALAIQDEPTKVWLYDSLDKSFPFVHAIRTGLKKGHEKFQAPHQRRPPPPGPP